MSLPSLAGPNAALRGLAFCRTLRYVYRRFSTVAEVPTKEVPKLTITPLEIAGLPGRAPLVWESTYHNLVSVLKFKGRVMIIDTVEEDARAAGAFDKETLLGFDSETKPSLVPGVTNKTAIIQVRG